MSAAASSLNRHVQLQFIQITAERQNVPLPASHDDGMGLFVSCPQTCLSATAP
jgi:hypothetical protein